VKFSEVRRLPKFIRHIAYFWRVRRALGSADSCSRSTRSLPACRLARRTSCAEASRREDRRRYAWEQGRQRFGLDATLDEFVRDARTACRPAPATRADGVATRAKHIIVPSAYLETIVAAWGIPVAR